MKYCGYNPQEPIVIIITLVNVLQFGQYGDTKCVSEARRVLKAGCENYCSENQCPEECTDCVSGFYGSDCRRRCRGNCLNGRCGLLANGRAINCTEGCVLGWRGLTCSTGCKRPCLECDRYTGDCVGECRDGFCGPGCLQRCPYTISKCDEKTCATPSKLEKATEEIHERGLNQTNISHINNLHDSYKEEHPRQSAAKVTPDSCSRQISPYFLTGIAVLAAVISSIVISVIRLKAMQTKADSVEKLHAREVWHWPLIAKSNKISAISPSHSEKGGRSDLETCVTENGFLIQKNHTISA